MLKTSEIPKIILEAYSANSFKQNSIQTIELLSKYLSEITNNPQSFPVLPWKSPEENIQEWHLDTKQKEDIESFITKFIEGSNHLHSPRYAGHQVSTALPTAAIAEFAYSLLNNGVTIYEMGPAVYGMERQLIKYFTKLLGHDEKADGVLTSGGSLGNLNALLSARQKMAGYDIWNEGNKDSNKLAIITSDEKHYCISRAAKIMGLGEEGIITIPVKDDYSFDHTKLPTALKQAQRLGRKVIAVCAGACSTSTGTYDDLNSIADFCETNNLWFHVDAAHGGCVAFSSKYQHLIAGINRADSVVWDAHKMLFVPSLITAVIFKDAKDSYAAFNQNALYLFENNSTEDSHDQCVRTLECTKPAMAMKMYMSLKIHGEDFFETAINYCYDLAKIFAELIEQCSDMELAKEPKSNIVCWRYLKPDLSEEDLNQLQLKIRQEIIRSGKFYLVKTNLRGKNYLRVSLMNPLTRVEELQELLELVKEVANAN
jgi:L-2,4-diaminobutyrate decarboxylase